MLSDMCATQKSCGSLKEVDNDIPVFVGNGEGTAVNEFGKIPCRSTVNGNMEETLLKYALFVPSIVFNLLSVSKIHQKGF